MKPLFIISCPIDTYSGYGARSRDIVKAIIELDKYTVRIMPQRWGNTPWGFIEDHFKEWGFLQSHLIGDNLLKTKPNIWAQITVPNEFQPVGDYNIGITAGIETTICHHSWLEGLNKMDLNLVSSEFSTEALKNTSYEINNQLKENVGDLKCVKPIQILLEGANLEKYFPLNKKTSIDLDEVKENFAFLSVGHWMQGDIGEDRKNMGLLIKLFYETFKNNSKAPALVLKTSVVGASYMDREELLSRINLIKKGVKADIFPNIYLLHGDLSDENMNELYNHKKIKAMVSFTKGEGYGRPLLEFSLTQKPIIASNWSGHLDFLDKKYTTLIEGSLTHVHQSAAVKNMLLPESKWFSPDPAKASKAMREMFENYKDFLPQAKLQYHKSKNSFSYEKMKESLAEILETNIGLHSPEVMALELPTLELPTLEIPTFD